MDSKNLHTGAANMFFPNAQKFLESALPQEFSLPIPIMKYIWENPSSSVVYEKLIKCCKLFFLKNPILVVNHLEYVSGNDWKLCTSYQSVCHGNYQCIQKQNHKKVDMKKFEGKIWLSQSLSVHTYEMSNVASTVIPKIYQCNAKLLILRNQLLSYDELKFLAAAGVKECTLANNIVKYENGENVTLEDLIKLFSGAKKVLIAFGNQPANATCKSYDDFIAACNTIEEVQLQSVPAAFDVPTFYKCLKKSQNRSKIEIDSLGDQERLQEVVDEILHIKRFKFVPPVIDYVGQDDWDNYDEMKQIQANAARGYY